MALSRLVYISENHLDPADGPILGQLAGILATSNRNNRRDDLTGALVFDDGWFLQSLEGEQTQVWTAFERIREDERHAGVRLLEFGPRGSRLFGNWWMGLATRSGATQSAFAPFLRNGMLQAQTMTADDVIALMVALARLGLNRELRAA